MDEYRRDGLIFDVEDDGPRDAEAVVLLHGFPQDSRCWSAVSARLTAAGYRTLAPDQRGYSPRAAPRSRSAYGSRDLGADVLALVDAAAAPGVHLVGHDWGGGLAWGLAARYPERFASLTVLSTPHPAAMAWALRHSGQGLRSWYMLAMQVPWLPEQVLARLLGPGLRATLPAAAAEHYARRFADPAALIGPVNWYRGIFAGTHRRRASRGGSGRARRGPHPRGGIEVPTTYVWGRRDPFLGRAAALRTADHVVADYRFVDLDADHWLPEKRPAEVADAILDRVRGAAAGSTGA